MVHFSVSFWIYFRPFKHDAMVNSYELKLFSDFIMNNALYTPKASRFRAHAHTKGVVVRCRATDPWCKN